MSKSLAFFHNITLTSGNGRKGVSYTNAERTLATHLLMIAACAVGRIEEVDLEEANIPDEVIEAFTVSHLEVLEATPNEAPLGTIARKAFVAVTNSRIEKGLEGFPKKRDYISLNLIFRKAAKNVPHFTQEEVDTLFRSPQSYGKKTG